ncbi:mechanosensitive ion channel [Amphritea sp. 1_MG-2023]|uniref:mechanosensitive ion channel family protein n=1 Tax=Amphritea sp. 1_MG-2023 TaxID=3062670 RepID=UPI0026E249F7|nr:mechanosensitive ion channel domain-containing protein [Amphritea sp. 1_MG-2023]MDO6561802.1 mechanosensitive ion channel [Amphritea sp. 1_MG-2023]
MEQLLEQVFAFLPLLLTGMLVLMSLLGLHWLLLARHPEMGNERKLPRQLILLALSLAGTVLIAIALPVSESTRNQVIGLIGVLVSGVIAFSSTAVITNLMAGVMLRNTRPFRVGDFIRVSDHFGRVSQRGLFDTEIQTEHRELVSLPNTYLISNPIEVVLSDGAIISATLSLGYDLHHGQIEHLLIQAAEETGLTEPFCQITELGDYAITYRVSGLLLEVTSLLTTRSNLYRNILDTLHRNDVEIVSPSFMNQRRLAENSKILPASVIKTPAHAPFNADDVVFDKAEAAQEREEKKLLLLSEIAALQAEAKNTAGDDKQRIAEVIEQKTTQVSQLEHANEETAEQQGAAQQPSSPS